MDDEEESSSDGTGSAPNGTLPVHHPRSASASVPDIRRPAVTKNTEKRRDQRLASSSRQQHPPPPPPSVSSLLQPPGAAGLAGTSPHTAKETFLNYFFGGPNGTGPPNQSFSAPSSAHGDRRVQKPAPTGFSREKDLLPDLGSNRRHSARQSLDSPPAYDMKSLGKHLEGVSRECAYGQELTFRLAEISLSI